MAFDIEEDGEVMAEALCDGFLQRRDPFVRELVSARGERNGSHQCAQEKSKGYLLDSLQFTNVSQTKAKNAFFLQLQPDSVYGTQTKANTNYRPHGMRACPYKW